MTWFHGTFIAEQAGKAILQLPALVRGFAFGRHGSRLPIDQSVKALSGNERSPTNPHGLEPLLSYVIVDRRSTQAGSMTSLLDAVGDLLWIFCLGLHGTSSIDDE